MHFERQVRQLAHKKIVFVIVEGPSDEDALGLFFNKIYDKNSVFVHVVHGDITTKKGSIKNRIADIIRAYANSNHLTKKDFQEVIHIVDMDGVFISDNEIIYDMEKDEPFYSTTEIRTSNRNGIILRNEIKRANLETISSLPTVYGGVPYHVYYMSCNLDHVLYDKLNCTNQEKWDNAFAFAKKYKDDINGFVSYIVDSEFAVCGTYLETWRFIKEGNHSLERHSNLGICVNSVYFRV